MFRRYNKEQVEREARADFEKAMSKAQPPTEAQRTWVLPLPETPHFAGGALPHRPPTQGKGRLVWVEDDGDDGDDVPSAEPASPIRTVTSEGPEGEAAQSPRSPSGRSDSSARRPSTPRSTTPRSTTPRSPNSRTRRRPS